MFKKDEVLRVVYLEHGASGTGASEDDALPIESASLGPLDEGEVVTAANWHVETSITGSTQVDVGNDDDADGYIAAPALTAGNVAGAGAELLVPKAAAGTVELTVAGASTAGKAQIVLVGYRL